MTETHEPGTPESIRWHLDQAQGELADAIERANGGDTDGALVALSFAAVHAHLATAEALAASTPERVAQAQADRERASLEQLEAQIRQWTEDRARSARATASGPMSSAELAAADRAASARLAARRWWQRGGA